MSSKIQKIMMSTALAASLGAVAVAAPFGTSQAFAATDSKSNQDKRKDRQERIENNAAFLAAQEAQFQALFGNQNDEATTEETTPEATTPSENTATNEATQANHNMTVVVPQGASLTELAAQYGVTVDQLVAANNLLPAGYQLTVPQK